MLVKHIITEDFETIPKDQTLDNAVELMLKNNVDYVFIMDDDPVAMITRRKALVACYKTDRPLSEIPISGFSRGLETTIGPNTTVLIAVGKLRRSKTECLPVVDGMSVQGVLTRDIVINNISNITNDILESEERLHEWAP